MLRIGKLTDYAILLMVELQASRRGLLSANTLAERARLELPTASKVLKLLARAGLILSTRGTNGGYRLAREPDGINVAEIIAAIEGPIAMTECSADVGICSQESHCALRSNWQRISIAVARALEEVSLREMARPLEPSVFPGVSIALQNMRIE